MIGTTISYRLSYSALSIFTLQIYFRNSKFLLFHHAQCFIVVQWPKKNVFALKCHHHEVLEEIKDAEILCSNIL